MSANRFQPHVVVLPEDRANEEIANGFSLSVVKARMLAILPPAGGWTAVRDSFEKTHNNAMQQNPLRRMVLLIDFDNRPTDERLDAVLGCVEPAIRDRVFVLGAQSEPEKLKKELGKYEAIGKQLAKDCVSNTRTAWDHPMLAHNRAELDRMIPSVRPILFGS